MKIKPSNFNKISKSSSRLLIAIVCGIIHFTIALKLRPLGHENHWSKETMLLLGSIPSFLASFGIYFLVTFSKKGKKNTTLLGIGIGTLIQETQQYWLKGSSIVGRTFDFGDILFIVLGCLTAYFVEKYFYLDKKQVI